jgi:hypothetical protein
MYQLSENVRAGGLMSYFIYSSDNVNGPTHIVFLLMEQKTGAKMSPLQLGGRPGHRQPARQQHHGLCSDPSVVGEHILGGKLKGLCVTDTQRWASLPNVQTCREAGIDIVFHFWRGVLVPAARTAGVEPLSLPIQRQDDFRGAFDRAASERAHAVTISLFTLFPRSGALMAYGPNFPEMWKRAATYIDRILKGSEVGELPIERPSKFELVINLKTAKALGLDVPWFLQQRVDEVIE